MYKIIKITDCAGNPKTDFMNELQAAHPEMNGQLLYPIIKEAIGMIRMCFIWADKSDKVLRTSLVKEVQETQEMLKVVTENSIYTLEKQ